MDRFWNKVKIGHPNQCWIWMAGKNNGGYGVFKYTNYTALGAHCVSWLLTYGKIPKGKRVLHKCDIRDCVNPSHLFLGTQSENIRDSIKKGRFTSGENHWGAKLNEKQVKKIRKDSRPLSVIAKEYGVKYNTIWRIKHKVRWAYV